MRNKSRRTPWIYLLNALCFLLISSGPLIRWKFTVFDVILLYIFTVLLGVCIALACVSFTKLKET
jgi:hypothetical protein